MPRKLLIGNDINVIDGLDRCEALGDMINHRLACNRQKWLGLI